VVLSAPASSLEWDQQRRAGGVWLAVVVSAGGGFLVGVLGLPARSSGSPSISIEVVSENIAAVLVYAPAR
jgi:hypothetical protein